MWYRRDHRHRGRYLGGEGDETVPGDRGPLRRGCWGRPTRRARYTEALAVAEASGLPLLVEEARAGLAQAEDLP